MLPYHPSALFFWGNPRLLRPDGALNLSCCSPRISTQLDPFHNSPTGRNPDQITTPPQSAPIEEYTLFTLILRVVAKKNKRIWWSPIPAGCQLNSSINPLIPHFPDIGRFLSGNFWNSPKLTIWHSHPLHAMMVSCAEVRNEPSNLSLELCFLSLTQL